MIVQCFEEIYGFHVCNDGYNHDSQTVFSILIEHFDFKAGEYSNKGS